MSAAQPNFLKTLRDVSLVLVCSLGLVACSAPSGAARHATPFLNPAMTMQQACDAVVIGKAGKADVLALLGPAREIVFNSGYAVWVYREAAGDSGADPAEFVVLIAPSGIVQKTRLRAQQPRQAN